MVNGKSKLARRFGQRLRKARDQAGLTQAQLFMATGIADSQLSNFENGKKFPSFETLRELCMALKVEGDYLLCRRGR